MLRKPTAFSKAFEVARSVCFFAIAEATAVYALTITRSTPDWDAARDLY